VLFFFVGCVDCTSAFVICEIKNYFTLLFKVTYGRGETWSLSTMSRQLWPVVFNCSMSTLQPHETTITKTCKVQRLENVLSSRMFVAVAVLSDVDCSECVDVRRFPANRAAVFYLHVLRQLFLCVGRHTHRVSTSPSQCLAHCSVVHVLGAPARYVTYAELHLMNRPFSFYCSFYED